MVKSPESDPINDLLAAVDAAMKAGVSTVQVQQMVAQRANDNEHGPEGIHTLNGLARRLGAEPGDDDGCDPNHIYMPDEVPEGLISLPDASKKYGIPVATLNSWVFRRKLPRRGRVFAPSAGGGYVLTDEAMILWCKDHPRKPWFSKSARS